MAPISPQLAGNVMPASPRSSSGSSRPSIMKRNSSQGVMRAALRSPGSEVDLQPLRHAVRPKGHARVVLPRNHSSGRNLAKLARQAAAGEAGAQRLHTRTRSHEGDTEIRLPGSLDESEVRPSTLRRNLTSSNLMKTASHTKLKKNLSHGHLQRLGTTRDLTPLTSSRQKTPLSPAIRGKSKRTKSLDWTLEKDLHEREVELAQEQREKREGVKKIGFDIGSDEDGDVPNMEGSQTLDEGEWTEESNSVSPYSTRANTAANSRRTSMHHDRLPDRSSLSNEYIGHRKEAAHQTAADLDAEADGTPATSYDGATESTDSTVVPPDIATETTQHATAPPDIVAETIQHAPAPHLPAVTRSPLHAAKEHHNPTASFLSRQYGQLPAPALVSNITASDDRSLRESPAGSLRSTAAASGGGGDELVSRFIPSTSNGSGNTTTMQNTPKSGSFQTNAEQEMQAHRERLGFAIGPVSPGSTVSGSSGAATPAIGRSRIELRMLQEKALADLESAVQRGPLVPAHVYDRRNESLKYHFQLAAMNNHGASGLGATLLGPEIFQGRFKAVNTELKVVQKFRNPLADSVARLQNVRGSKLNLKASQKNGLRSSKSAVTLPMRGHAKKESSHLSTSVTPPGSEAIQKPTLATVSSAATIKPTRRTATRGVSFAGIENLKESEPEDYSLDDIAKEMWDSVMS